MAKHLEMDQLDQKRLIKNNDLEAISNPIMFNSNNGPTTDGLLSNEIFGITKEDRGGIFAYIDLKETFINPYYYKLWLKIDSRLRSIIYETATYKLDSKGYLVEDDNGQTGLKFLKNNIDKLKFKDTKREYIVKVLKEKDKIFTDKFVIIPPYYRDVNNSGGGKVGVGEINKLYIQLLNNIKALNESNEYGLSMAGGIRGKVQDIMLEIYNWFTTGKATPDGENTGTGIFSKTGIMRRSVLSKTTDNGARLVLSQYNPNVDSKEELMVDMNYSTIPLSAACVISYPFMMYELRHFFNNEFGGKMTYKYVDKNNKMQEVELDSPEIAFSDERFDKELNEFIHGYSNRFKPIEVPIKDPKKKIHLAFEGYNISHEEFEKNVQAVNDVKKITRRMTWMDLFYICACQIFEDKAVLISRYPIDSYFNQLTSRANITSTLETETMSYNGKFYKWFPKLRDEDIGTDTSNLFIDTLSVANPYCLLMGADYDGDQVTVKMPYTIEANKELLEHMNSNSQFITLSGINGRTADKESIMAMYSMTLVLDQKKLTDPQF